MYYIKTVWGYAESHDGELHFKTKSAATRLAGSTSPVLIYKTGKRRDTVNKVLIGLGHVTESVVRASDEKPDGVPFPFSVPFKTKFEFNPEEHELGIRLSEFQQLIGRKPHMLAVGGLVLLSEAESVILCDELWRRYQSHRSA